LKIVSIGPASPFRGGIAKFNESFALACRSEGHDTEIISYTYMYPRFLFPGKTQYTSEPLQEGLLIRPLIHSLNPLSWTKAASGIIDSGPGLVVFHYWMPFFAPALGVIARTIRKSCRAGMIAITHNVIPHEKQPGTKLLSRFFLGSMDRIVALSSSVVRDLGDLDVSLKEKTVLLPHPVYDIYGSRVEREEAAGILGLDPAKKYLLFFGLIRKYKGLDLLLESFALLAMDDLRLIVAGEFYEDRMLYFGKAKKLNIYDKIIFTDKYIPDSEVKYYFSLADTVVQPYITATQSGVTQIGYQVGCPMVVTDAGGLPEMVIHGKTGFVCRKDPEEIAEAIKLSLEPEIRNRLISGITEEKKKFEWNVFVSNLTALQPVQ